MVLSNSDATILRGVFFKKFILKINHHRKMNLTTEQKIYYSLRLAVALCFLGHGMFGIITKPIWCNYFGMFGIDHQTAYRLMPFVGAVDIFMGIGMIVYPLRAIPLWLVGWGFVTALLRPLSGEPVAEFIERSANFGAPLALLLLAGGAGKNLKDIFLPLAASAHVERKIFRRLFFCLQVIVFLLLAGHGWLNVMEKKGLILQYAMLGFSNPHNTAITIGILEIIAAFTVLIRPLRSMLLILIIWKVVSEFFYPHYEMVEWIERGGSYGCLVALWLATREGSDRRWFHLISMTGHFLR
jgi:hypothetical protein